MIEEKAFVKNSKGLNLAAIVNVPDKKKRYPAVIILHGFTGYKEEAHLQYLAKDLARNGFVAIRFDASGSGDSEGTFEKDYRMSNYLKDIESVYNFLQKQNFVDKNRIAAIGHSMGAQLAIIFAAKHPEIKTCVAISSPTILADSDWLEAIAEEWQRLGWFQKKISKDGKLVRIPFSFVVDSNKYDTLNFIQEVRCPFLDILGLADKVVGPKYSKEIFEKANEPKELFEIPNIGHDYKKDSKLIGVVNKKILSFIKKYL